MRRKLAPTFPTEAALCADFIDKVKKQPWNQRICGHWTCYAETAGWDILMVRKEDGCQIGVEAKLDLNITVVNQALVGINGIYRDEGPDFRAILVPAERINQDYVPICEAIGITVMWIPYDPEKYYVFHPHPPGFELAYWDRDWHPCLPMKRHRLPEYIPDVVAGASAPVQLSPWKVAALKLCVLLEEGPVTRADLKALGLSATRWTDRHYGWLQPTPNGYIKSSRCPDFPGQHLNVYAQIKADKAKWIFPRQEISHGQRSLGLENE